TLCVGAEPDGHRRARAGRCRRGLVRLGLGVGLLRRRRRALELLRPPDRGAVHARGVRSAVRGLPPRGALLDSHRPRAAPRLALQLLAERSEREHPELEVLPRERDADDGQRQPDAEDEVAEEDADPRQHEPEHVEREAPHAGSRRVIEVVTEWHEPQLCELEALQPEGNAHHGEAEQHPGEQVLEADQPAAAEDDPQDVEEEVHASIYAGPAPPISGGPPFRPWIRRSASLPTGPPGSKPFARSSAARAPARSPLSLSAMPRFRCARGLSCCLASAARNSEMARSTSPLSSSSLPFCTCPSESLTS